MAWGGPEEQKRECEAGNPNAKDWHDEARRIVERTMEEYWDARPMMNETRTSDQLPNQDSSQRVLESEYDHHHHKLAVETAMSTDNGGWKAELRYYLNDIPLDVSKDTDIVVWWAVWLSILVFLFSTKANLIGSHQRVSDTFTHCKRRVCNSGNFSTLRAALFSWCRNCH